MRTNLLGVWWCGLAAMAVRVPRRAGVIVNVTSGALLGNPGYAVYGSTKGAVASLTWAWALELADHGIRVHGVSPLAKSGLGGTDRGGNVVDKAPADTSPEPAVASAGEA